MAVEAFSEDFKRLLDALAAVEAAERRLAIEVAVYRSMVANMHPDDVPKHYHAVVYAAMAVLDRVTVKPK